MKQLELTEDEQKQIEQRREMNRRKTEASIALEEWAKKYDAQLIIDPNSPIGNPKITIHLLDQ